MTEIRTGSIIFVFIGGIIGLLFSFGMLPMCSFGWIGSGRSDCIFFYYLGGISLLAIIGAFLEFRSLIIGSVICVISGFLGIVIAVIMSATISTLSNPIMYIIIYSFNIVGGSIGIMGFYKVNKS
jgi:hypothetical protein